MYIQHKTFFVPDISSPQWSRSQTLFELHKMCGATARMINSRIPMLRCQACQCVTGTAHQELGGGVWPGGVPCKAVCEVRCRA